MLINRHPDAVLVSARTGEGVDDLRDRLAAAARAGLTRLEVMVPYASGQVISAIYAAGRDVEQEPGERGTLVRALMPAPEAARIRAALNGGGG
jgi:GTP-binding protein HflX